MPLTDEQRAKLEALDNATPQEQIAAARELMDAAKAQTTNDPQLAARMIFELPAHLMNALRYIDALAADLTAVRAEAATWRGLVEELFTGAWELTGYDDDFITCHYCGVGEQSEREEDDGRVWVDLIHAEGCPVARAQAMLEGVGE